MRTLRRFAGAGTPAQFAGPGTPAQFAGAGTPGRIPRSGSLGRHRATVHARLGGSVVALLVLVAWFAGTAGCGGAPPAPPGEPSSGASASAPDPRTPIERRRDAACDQLAPKITACAVEDARADLAAGTIDRRQLEIDTAPGVQRKHTDEFARACKAARYTSRQVRVLEVCFRQEPACPALLDCLGHLQDADPGDPRRP